MRTAMRAVIMDVDGTIINSEEIKIECHRQAVQSFGGVWKDELYLEHLGKSGEEVSQAIVEAAGLTCTTQKYRESYRAHKARHTEIVMHPWFPYFIRAAVLRHRFPLAFMSSGYKTAELHRLVVQLLDMCLIPPNMTLRLHVHGLDSEFLPHGKKTPEGVKRLVHSIGVQAEDVLGFEDSLTGMQAMQEAGLGTLLFVRHGANQGVQLPENWRSERHHEVSAKASWQQMMPCLRW